MRPDGIDLSGLSALEFATMCIYYDSQPYPLQFLERMSEDGEESGNNMEDNDEVSQADEANSQDSPEESYGEDDEDEDDEGN